MARVEEGLTVEERALDATYSYMLERRGAVGVKAFANMHGPNRTGGRWRCTHSDCDNEPTWPCKWVRRAWKAHQRMVQGLPS